MTLRRELLNALLIALNKWDVAEHASSLFNGVKAALEEGLAQLRDVPLLTGDTLVELLEARDPGSPIGKFVAKRGPGIHHICFAVDDLDAALAIWGRGEASCTLVTPAGETLVAGAIDDGHMGDGDQRLVVADRAGALRLRRLGGGGRLREQEGEDKQQSGAHIVPLRNSVGPHEGAGHVRHRIVRIAVMGDAADEGDASRDPVADAAPDHRPLRHRRAAFPAVTAKRSRGGPLPPLTWPR